ncbi:TPA: DUF3272 domain-containing protein [Streptococcus suis]|uniref:DUF3272 domain-containing protein n=1 Tax=Streptococcus suis TaxID=1307 RepID=UPI000CF42E0B|nr:DUF3272 domain-containing protein [Streptococcus suis]MBO4133309.1 DUF3272 domain-containing protein [Streptococcus suis]HEM4974656.1 DUF3272 domain-containing protein [Streptococcus suis]HEM5057011.1 DUF3272 domain-containing protein [Streptococcus suis]HEM5067394.1 DUF3272 domain-containing protein [Streptococcus suis]HEM5164187.1 DUF3272 domain-containing protein [Streptococcus suis]
MKLPQFLFLAITTILAVYFMNASVLTGDFLIAGIYAFIAYRNLHFAYKVTKFIRLVEKQTKK